jgi:hypothetical protein
LLVVDQRFRPRLSHRLLQILLVVDQRFRPRLSHRLLQILLVVSESEQRLFSLLRLKLPIEKSIRPMKRHPALVSSTDH